MSKDIRIRKGFNLNLDGEANKIFAEISPSKTFALKPDDFFGSTPKMLVKEGEKVKKGTPLFFSKNNPKIHFVSPVGGDVTAIVRGAKRKILEVVVTASESQESIKHDIPSIDKIDINETKEILLKSGAWPFIIQRPYGTIANPEDKPKAIFISAFSTAPLNVEYSFIIKNHIAQFQKGIQVLNKLVPNCVNLVVDGNFSALFEQISEVNLTKVTGLHPAGNVGVQIHHIDPINAGEKVWVIRPEDVVNIGNLFTTGEFSAQRTVAIAGTSVKNPQYYKSTIGSSISSLLAKTQLEDEKPNRIINGDVLSGSATSIDGYLGYYNNLISIIPEGNDYRMFGWLPFVDNSIPSMSKTSLSWLFGKQKAKVNTNMNGEERALVVTGEMERVLPMDIYPMQLLKAILIEDIERMEALGIYEVVPEDFALIDYSSTSKIEAQEIIRQGIELMLKEEG